MKKTFYAYPYRKKELQDMVLYDDAQIFQTRLFQTFYKKLGNNTIKLFLRTRRIINFIFAPFNKITLDVPSGKINLVYLGYDNIHYFQMNQNHIEKMYTKKTSSFEEVSFLGYPIIEDYHQPVIKNASIIKQLLINHWSGLKQGTNTPHGDFSPFNILVKDNMTTLIDPKPNTQPPIFDLYYFYAAAIHKFRQYRPRSKKRIEHIQKEFKAIYGDIFSENEKQLIRHQFDDIKKSEVGNSLLFPTYWKDFLSLLD